MLHDRHASISPAHVDTYQLNCECITAELNGACSFCFWAIIIRRWHALLQPFYGLWRHPLGARLLALHCGAWVLCFCFSFLSVCGDRCAWSAITHCNVCFIFCCCIAFVSVSVFLKYISTLNINLDFMVHSGKLLEST